MAAVNNCTDKMTDRERGETNRERYGEVYSKNDDSENRWRGDKLRCLEFGKYKKPEKVSIVLTLSTKTFAKPMFLIF